MAFVPKYDHDLFISYAHLDGFEWVQGYVSDLQEELVRLTPGRIKPIIFLDDQALRAGDEIDARVAAAIESSAILVPVVSPNYQASPYCIGKELALFQRLNGAQSERILQIIRVPLPPPAQPPVRNNKWIRFCDHIREHPRGSTAYRQAMDKIVEALLAKLLAMRRESQSLYIAWPADRLHPDRESIEKEFQDRGYVLLPNQVFTEFTNREDIGAELGGADVSIHLFDRQPDLLADTQLAIAVELGKPTIIVTRSPIEPRRGHLDGEIPIYLKDPNARQSLIDRVKRTLGTDATTSRAALPVFLLYQREIDARCAWNCTALLKERARYDLEILQPDADDPHFELNLDQYVPQLGRARGVVVCWGDAPQAWFEQIDRKLTSMMLVERRLSGLRRANYYGEPFPKEVKSLRNVFEIRQDPDIDPFLAALRSDGR